MSPETPLFLQPRQYDWNRLAAEYDWLRGLQGCPQDAVHHSEGDVFIHTEMVVDALVSLPEWQALPPREQAMTYAAALLHDVAKPVCTAPDEAGRIHSPATPARESAWRAASWPRRLRSSPLR